MLSSQSTSQNLEFFVELDLNVQNRKIFKYDLANQDVK